MSDTALEIVLRRDRMIVVAALVALTLLAWAYVFWLAATMNMGAAGAMSMANMPGMAPEIRAWSLTDFGFTFGMWAVMMVGMMTPSASPMILLYARVGRQAEGSGRPFASAGWFASGYLAAWTAFALVATAAQDLLTRAALLTPMLKSANGLFGGLVLILAGAFRGRG